ncbi:hypothetical protein PTTG_26977 [Puccinia triticina 1-1 BBBD Race 1]|uniref:Secreted protein n=2 Tax=Puccinia triticina TaxID=208348 RepID=A0A180GQ47_PUCT1|nr:uncharacterized protein PtA15_12A407 [Puccinia triticina]OAV94509.1 hypothetical protein PTTG_26977 [Puccinia triticina 1-1 BBBD Race 1]WAQ90418.1 hypothetical protein PtA15_12A407 [Puccinia triticina]WAR61734.1 hypothetical protein PtB15_12B424 [Puccinia triticina]
MKLSTIFLTLIICHGLFEGSGATPVPKRHHGHKEPGQNETGQEKHTKSEKNGNDQTLKPLLDFTGAEANDLWQSEFLEEFR